MPADRHPTLSTLPKHDVSLTDPLTPPTPSTPGTLRGLNPLSTKVITVLSTSYADHEFRETLALLDERAVKNTPETRRNLRLAIQKEVIEANGEIIDEFGKVADQLRKIGGVIADLNQSYQAIKTEVEAAHKQTAPFLEEATKLMTERAQIVKKEMMLNAMRDHFILSQDEIDILTLTSEPVDDRFFQILEKAKKILKDSEVLLGFENQTLGLELTEKTSKELNQAFQKIYRWIQREFKTLNLENPQIGADVRKALRVLAERPSLFQSCMDSFAESREQILSDSFYTALTGTTKSGEEDPSIKPIEMVAHDVLRYVGDMLAWTHSATVGEREALEVLFVAEGEEITRGIETSDESELRRLMNDGEEEPPQFDPVQALNELVDRDVSGVARLLRQRIEEVIHGNEDTIMAFKLANLLNFYRLTFSTRLLAEGSLLLESLDSMEREALRQFRSLMKDHITTIQGEFQHPPADLSPPDFLHEALKQLKDIMKTYETSLTPQDQREADFQGILAEAYDPFIEGCKNMSRNMPVPSNYVFLINCFQTIKAVLKPFIFTRPKVEEMRDGVEEIGYKVVDAQYKFFRDQSGLGDLFDALLQVEQFDGPTVRQLAAVQPQALQNASQILDDFLPSAMMDAMDNIKYLQDNKMARGLTAEAAEKFCDDFEHVEHILNKVDEDAEEEADEAGEEFTEAMSLRAVFPRTVAEIRVLLS